MRQRNRNNNLELNTPTQTYTDSSIPDNVHDWLLPLYADQSDHSICLHIRDQKKSRHYHQSIFVVTMVTVYMVTV